jgi:hypothetical protein
MQEESDPVGMPTPPQGVGDRDQVIVVDPDEIVILDDLFEFGREMKVDAEISAEVTPRKLGKIQPIMQNWPQHPIGETVIVFLKFVFGEIGDDVLDIVTFDGSRSQFILRADLSAPSDPDAAVAVQRRPQRHLKPAGALGAVARRH